MKRVKRKAVKDTYHKQNAPLQKQKDHRTIRTTVAVKSMAAIFYTHSYLIHWKLFYLHILAMIGR